MGGPGARWTTAWLSQLVDKPAVNSIVYDNHALCNVGNPMAGNVLVGLERFELSCPKTPVSKTGVYAIPPQALGTPGPIRTANRGFGGHSRHHPHPEHTGGESKIRLTHLPDVKELIR